MRPEWIARHEKENYTLGRGSLPFSRALVLCVRFGSGRCGLSSHIDNLKNRYYDIVVLKAHLGGFSRKPIYLCLHGKSADLRQNSKAQPIIFTWHFARMRSIKITLRFNENLSRISDQNFEKSKMGISARK